MIEYAWSKTTRYRNIDERRDGSYPSYRRLDAKYWARWKFYPGAMLMMPTRLVLFGFNLAFMVFLVRILCICHDFDKKPLGGCRKKMVFFIVRTFC